MRFHTFTVLDIATMMHQGPGKSRACFGFDPVEQAGANLP